MPPPEAIRFGQSLLPCEETRAARGRIVTALGEQMYVIEDAQELPPFLTTLLSDSDHWLFSVSNGGLTAGRRNPGLALFPYATEDKLADSAGVTGPATAILAARGGRTSLWRPFRDADRLVYPVTRRLYRSLLGNRLVFEEENAALGLRFRYGWQASERHGLVRSCNLSNLGAEPVAIRIQDGLLNLLPAGAEEELQLRMSCLLDAYKRSEWIPGTTLALFALAAQPSDRPEPKEALRATTVWSHGLDGASVLLSAEQGAGFERGRAGEPRREVRGRRGAYLLEAALELAPGAERSWQFVAEVGASQADVVRLLAELRRPGEAAAALAADLARGTGALRGLAAAVDGISLSADMASCAHHTANALFSAMRGGLFPAGYEVEAEGFARSVERASRATFARQQPFLASLPARFGRAELLRRLEAQGDPDLLRLGLEYLPLAFSRRHGDPSRPWNRFDIRLRDGSGRRVLAYEGNWRDIFQNWEALARSFPGYAEGFVARFLDASTADGHNPYRIGDGGVGWETPDPAHPWAAIGYWGDHQIVYLHRLLELTAAHHPGRLERLLDLPIFTYADVPYEIAPYAQMARNPRATIRFDEEKQARIAAREAEQGSDARLLQGPGGLVRATLAEKLLVPALAKLASFVPGGGIWMNTQRPEWNDANNALAGYGLSVVTLCHLERYLAFLGGLLAPGRGSPVRLAPEVATWAGATREALLAHRGLLEAPEVGELPRRQLMEALGEAASVYREALYRRGLSPAVPVPPERILELTALARAFLLHTLAASRRPDGLTHAYNLLVPRGEGFGVERLPLMLEGQAAALAAAAPAEVPALLDALAGSALYRPDQDSYLLYPDRELPGFLARNVIPEEALARAPFVARLAASGEGRLVARDAEGQLRFGADLADAESCRRAAEAVGASAEEVEEALRLYEQVFRHRTSTGRSSSMFAYEGLGSVYWHMVGKLLLAVQERFYEAWDAGQEPLAAELRRRYYRLRAGMGGLEKSPAQWGAFPLDPYSHTPAGSGARQPGMTGQAKEQVLLRLGELGVRVRGGQLSFQPALLRRAELLSAPATLELVDPGGGTRTLELPAGSLAFTCCQVPVVYRLGDEPRLTIAFADGSAPRVLEGRALDAELSARVFARDGRVARIDVEARLDG